MNKWSFHGSFLSWFWCRTKSKQLWVSLHSVTVTRGVKLMKNLVILFSWGWGHLSNLKNSAKRQRIANMFDLPRKTGAKDSSLPLWKTRNSAMKSHMSGFAWCGWSWLTGNLWAGFARTIAGAKREGANPHQNRKQSGVALRRRMGETGKKPREVQKEAEDNRKDVCQKGDNSEFFLLVCPWTSSSMRLLIWLMTMVTNRLRTALTLMPMHRTTSTLVLSPGGKLTIERNRHVVNAHGRNLNQAQVAILKNSHLIFEKGVCRGMSCLIASWEMEKCELLDSQLMLWPGCSQTCSKLRQTNQMAKKRLMLLPLPTASAHALEDRN